MELRSMLLGCLGLPLASSSLCVASRARITASRVSPLYPAGARGLAGLPDSSPGICRMSICQGVVVLR
eukprot:3257096-Pyramimonas_sp.AAC.1